MMTLKQRCASGPLIRLICSVLLLLLSVASRIYGVIRIRDIFKFFFSSLATGIKGQSL